MVGCGRKRLIASYLLRIVLGGYELLTSNMMVSVSLNPANLADLTSPVGLPYGLDQTRRTVVGPAFELDRW